MTSDVIGVPANIRPLGPLRGFVPLVPLQTKLLSIIADVIFVLSAGANRSGVVLSVKLKFVVIPSNARPGICLEVSMITAVTEQPWK